MPSFWRKKKKKKVHPVGISCRILAQSYRFQNDYRTDYHSFI